MLEAESPNVAPDWPARDYEQALAHLRNPKRLSQGLLLIGTLALFLLVQKSDSGRSLLILISVLLFHEAGHYAGMRLFGYRDVRMFFIPLFGAAVSGRRGDVAPWKEGIVLLLGPMPGIVVGFALGFTTTSLSPLARELALTLVGLNLFNLVPIGGLDGARLLQLLLFSRRRWLEIAFQVFAAAAAAVLAVSLQSFGLGLMASMMLLILPHRLRVLKAADRLARTGLPLPTDPAALEDEAARAVFVEARNTMTSTQRKPANVAATMQQLLDTANTKHPTAEATIILGTALFVAFVLGVAGLMSLAPALPG